MRIDIVKFCVENNLNETDFRLKLVEFDSKYDTSKTVEKTLAETVLATLKNGLVLSGGDDQISQPTPNQVASLESELVSNSIETLKVADYLVAKTNEQLLKNYQLRNLELVEKIREIRVQRLDALELALSDLENTKVENVVLTPINQSKFNFFI
jgi:dTDP-4-dehydrorhamnose reductase